MLDVANVSKTYAQGGDRVAVFSDISFSLGAGQALALTGESGSGKSTLLNVIAGLEDPDTGTVHIGGQLVTGQPDTVRAGVRRAQIGLVFQQFNLIPSLSIAQNIAFQARLAGRLDSDWCATLTDRLGLRDLTGRYPEQLSGGQQQRVAIARALAARPGLILADEPTGNLDEAKGDEVLDLFLELVAQAGAALVFVTHSSRLAGRLPSHLRLHGGGLSA